MGFDTNLLNDHETIAADLRPHPWYFASSVCALIGAIILGVLVMAIPDPDSWVRTVFGPLSLILIIATAVWVLSRFVGWLSTNFVVTSDRVIYRSGVLHKRGTEIPLERVNTVHFGQRLFERMLGTGDLTIESGATDGMQKFTDIRDPDHVQKLIHQQIELKRNRPAQAAAYASSGDMTPPPPGAPVAPADVATQLEKLEGMLHRGTLTQAEFDAQKERLLGS